MNEQEKDAKRKQRIAAFGRTLPSFLAVLENELGHSGFTIRPEAEIDLGNVHFTIHDEVVMPHVSENSNGFKIASVTEQAILLVQPFEHQDTVIRNDANALFAFSCAMRVIEEMELETGVVRTDLWDWFGSTASPMQGAMGQRLVAFDLHKHFQDAFIRAIQAHRRFLETLPNNEEGGMEFPTMYNAAYLDLLWYSLHIDMPHEPRT